MPRVSQLVSVNVLRDGSDNGKRRWSVKAEADGELFLLSDELAKEGLIKDVELALRIATKRAVVDYITSGREFIKSAAKKEKSNTGAK